MKKIVAKILSLALSLALVLSICASCDWITVNTDRDMDQVIASVKVSDSVDAESVKKKELNAGFVSYGYQYVQYYGYTTSQAYQVVLDNLVANRIVVQQARISLSETYNGLLTKDTGLTEFEEYFKANALAGGKSINPQSGEIENLKNYLTEYEYAQVMYETRKNVNDLIESYEEEDEEDAVEKENVSVADRVSPTVEDNSGRDETELKADAPTEDEIKIAELVIGDDASSKASVYELDMAVFGAYKIDISNNKKKKAFSELLTFLKDTGLILSTESHDIANSDNVLNYSYFQEMTKQLIENVIVAKYEESLKAGTEAKLTDDGIWEEYVKEYQNQEALYKNNISSYETALDAASDTSFVLYNPFENYGYVLNLLVPFSAEQTASLDEKKAEAGITENDVLAYREQLATNIVAKDQRESWVYSSYGKYNKDSKTFTFDKDYRNAEIESLNDFIGEVIVRKGGEDGITEKDENGVDQTTWSFANVVASEMSMTDLFADYITPNTGITELYFEENNETTIGSVTYSEDIFDKFNELMYAFSTDAGCLGKEYGYLYSPYTHTYVEEFEKASKAVVEKGVGAYTTVLTDYGYHVIICTKLVETTYDISDASKTQFMADLKVEDTLAYNYRQVKLDSIVSSEISKVASKLINEYKDDEDKVTYFKNTYSDLITETEEE